MHRKLITGATILAVSALAGGAAQAASKVEIKEAAARVTVVPENRPDVRVEFLTTNGALPLQVREFGDKVVVDGNLKNRIRQCNGAQWNLDVNGHRSVGSNVNVTVKGVGRVAWADLPQIVVHTPMRAQVATSGAVFGTVGRAAAVTLDSAGCGDWTVANVNGPLSVDIAGSSDVRAGTAREAWVRVAGSGDVTTQAIFGPGDIRIAGSGDVRLAAVMRSLKAQIAGSGDVHVDSGRVDEMSANIAGSGDVVFGGVAGNLNASIAGSGDVRAGSVSGSIKRAVIGSGSVYVAGQELRRNRDND
jgi:hypothetical protein